MGTRDERREASEWVELSQGPRGLPELDPALGIVVTGGCQPLGGLPHILRM